MKKILIKKLILILDFIRMSKKIINLLWLMVIIIYRKWEKLWNKKDLN